MTYNAAFSLTLQVDNRTLKREGSEICEYLDDVFFQEGYTVLDGVLTERETYVGLMTDEKLQASHSKDCCDNAIRKLERVCLDNGFVVQQAITYGASYTPNFIYDGITIEELCPTHAMFKMNALKRDMEPVNEA